MSDVTTAADVPVTSIEDIMKVIVHARELFDDKTSISLSCVRPGGRYRVQLDTCAILAGIDRIAVPSKGALQTCKAIGIKAEVVEHGCCFTN